MANREALIPDLNGGEGLELAHHTNSTVQTVGKMQMATTGRCQAW